MEKILNIGPLLISQDKLIADLLGLTLSEYQNLSHSGVRELRGLGGQVMYNYIIVSPLNKSSTLSKLKMNKSGMIFLPPDLKKSASSLNWHPVENCI